MREGYGIAASTHSKMTFTGHKSFSKGKSRMLMLKASIYSYNMV
jgi:hypothetical protein